MHLRLPRPMLLGCALLIASSSHDETAPRTAYRWLISPEEAWNHRSEESRVCGVLMRVKREDGPIVTIVRPTSNRVENPVEIDVRFSPRDAPVDLKTLEFKGAKRLKYLDTYSPVIDLLPRVRQFVTPDGSDIRISHYRVPAGRYRFELALKDTAGRESRGEIYIEVAD